MLTRTLLLLFAIVATAFASSSVADNNAFLRAMKREPARRLKDCETCILGEDFLFTNPCSGFDVVVADFFDFYPDDGDKDECKEQCCAPSKDLCCESSTGAVVGFVFGVVGVAIMVLFCAYKSLTGKKAASPEAEESK